MHPVVQDFIDQVTALHAFVRDTIGEETQVLPDCYHKITDALATITDTLAENP